MGDIYFGQKYFVTQLILPKEFGDTIKSGSSYYQFLTSHTAEQYLKHAPRMTVVRIPDQAYSFASSSVHYSGSLATTTHWAQNANENPTSRTMNIYTLLQTKYSLEHGKISSFNS